MKKLSLKQKMQLFYQLAVLEESGIPVTKALTTISKSGPGAFKRKCARTAKLIGQSYDLASAGSEAGIFSESEARVISLASAAGRTPETFRLFARYYEDKVTFWRKIVSNMIYPVLIVLIAIFIVSLPALVLGDISLEQYLMATIGLVVEIAVLVMLFFKLPAILRFIGFGLPLDWLLLRLPIFGRKLERRAVQQFTYLVSIMLDAGVPAMTAVPEAIKGVGNHVAKRSLANSMKKIENGEPFVETLAANRLFRGIPAEFLHTGAASGNIPELMLRYSRMEEEALAEFWRQTSIWIPRIIYFGIVIFLAIIIIKMGTAVFSNLNY